MTDTARANGNLSPRGRRQRRVLGVVAGVATAAGLVYVGFAEPPLSLRLLLVAVPAFVAGLGLFQAQAST